MNSEKEYQQNELKRFMNQNSAYFDTVKEFDASLNDMDIEEQIDWIENGSYGAGACFSLQMALKGITPRCNGPARIGNMVLHAFYGKPFRYYNKLSDNVQKKLNKAIEAWLKKEHSFAQNIL